MVQGCQRTADDRGMGMPCKSQPGTIQAARGFGNGVFMGLHALLVLHDASITVLHSAELAATHS